MFKKLLLLLPIILIGAVVVWNLKHLPKPKPQTPLVNPPVVINLVNFENPNKKVSFPYPQVSSGLSKDQMVKFNDFASKSAERIYNTEKGELPHLWTGDITIERSDSKVISAWVNITEITQGTAHYLHFSDVFNYSMVGSKEITLDDIFDPKTDYLNKLTTIVRQKLDQGYKDDGTWYDGVESFINDGVKPDVKSFQRFVIGKDYLVFIYDPYEAGSYVDGVRKAKISFSELKGLLKTDLL